MRNVSFYFTKNIFNILGRLVVLSSLLFIADGTTFADEDSLNEKKAFGSLEFGDSKATVRRKLEKEPSVKIGNWHDVKDGSKGYDVKIGSFTYRLATDFYQDKLYMISFLSDLMDASYFNTKLKDMWENLVNVISKQYSQYCIKSGQYKSILEVELTNYRWVYKTKLITLYIREDCYPKYAVTLSIIDMPIGELAIKESELEKQREIEKYPEKF